MRPSQDEPPDGKAACPVCGSGEHAVLVTLPDLPVHCNFLFQSRKEALEVARAPIELVRCRDCRHAFNRLFDPTLVEYRNAYENSLFYSPTFRTYAEDLARDIVERRGIRNGTVLEIGAGDGRFLRLLCDLGQNRGVAFEPSRSSQEPTADGPIEFVADFYDARSKTYRPDLVCCRQVLEHVREPIEFLRSIRRPLDTLDRTAVFFEVPNGTNMLQEGRVWDIIYEHYSYFSAESLSRAFQSAGFEVTRVEETFRGQYLCLDAATTPNGSRTSVAAEQYQGNVNDDDLLRKRLATWHAKVAELRTSQCRVAVWGAGSKGVTFLNLMNRGDFVHQVIDVNPRKVGMFVAGTGHRIDTVESLSRQPPDVVLIANSVYRSEIQKALSELAVSAELLCL